MEKDDILSTLVQSGVMWCHLTNEINTTSKGNAFETWCLCPSVRACVRACMRAYMGAYVCLV